MTAEYLITDIKEITSKKKLVYINYEPAFALYAGEIKDFKLHADEVIPDNVYDEIVDVLSKRALTRALHLFKDRDYTENEIRVKLTKSYYPLASADSAVEYLKENHFIDDYRYAYNYICFRIDKMSKRVLSTKLQQKGIDISLIEKAFRQYDEDNAESTADAEYSTLTNIMLKKLNGRNPSDMSYEERQKLFAYLYRKGFAYDDCAKVFSMICEANMR